MHVQLWGGEREAQGDGGGAEEPTARQTHPVRGRVASQPPPPSLGDGVNCVP